MAEQDPRQTSDIVRQLITSVKQLSDQMASGSQPRSVDNEISQVFGRSRATNAGPSSTISTSSGIGVGGNSSCASQAGGLSHFRRLSNQRRIGSNVNKRTKNLDCQTAARFYVTWFCWTVQQQTWSPGRGPELPLWSMATCSLPVGLPRQWPR